MSTLVYVDDGTNVCSQCKRLYPPNVAVCVDCIKPTPGDALRALIDETAKWDIYRNSDDVRQFVKDLQSRLAALPPEGRHPTDVTGRDGRVHRHDLDDATLFTGEGRQEPEDLTRRELNWLIDLVRAQRLNDNSERGPLLLKLSARADGRAPTETPK